MSEPAEVIEQVLVHLYITEKTGSIVQPSDVAFGISQALTASGYSIIPTDRLNRLHSMMEQSIEAAGRLRAILAGAPTLDNPKEHLAYLRQEANKARDRADVFAKSISK